MRFYVFRATIDGIEDKTHHKLIFREGTHGNRNNRASAFYVCSINGGLEQKVLFRNHQKQQLYLISGYKGLFLLSDGCSSFVLWNPFTKQYKNLAACPLKRRDHKCRVGLGYDSASDDYKVVLFDSKSTWIFGLRSDSWRRIDGEFLPNFGDFDGWSCSAYFAHGNLHWLYIPLVSFPNQLLPGEQNIIAFDVANEKFSQVMMPPAEIGFISNLSVVKECLCVNYVYSGVGKVYLYRRNNDGDDYTWSILCSIQLRSLDIEDFNYVRIVGYSEEGNKILLDVGFVLSSEVIRMDMISYDLEEKFLLKVDFPAEEYAYGWGPRMFKPSFVNITGAWKPLKEENFVEE